MDLQRSEDLLARGIWARCSKASRKARLVARQDLLGKLPRARISWIVCLADYYRMVEEHRDV